ncbi:hypothetical protein SSKA14_215 [Stenotrophomonas sp. SKA14]|nr:hypothetical protein SSKA14_215 [Stenotrophomonas sp. SKA14]
MRIFRVTRASARASSHRVSTDQLLISNAVAAARIRPAMRSLLDAALTVHTKPGAVRSWL